MLLFLNVLNELCTLVADRAKLLVLIKIEVFSYDLDNLFNIRIQCVHVLKNSKIFYSMYEIQRHNNHSQIENFNDCNKVPQ